MCLKRKYKELSSEYNENRTEKELSLQEEQGTHYYLYLRIISTFYLGTERCPAYKMI